MACIEDCPIRKRLSSKMRIKWYGFFCPWTTGKDNLCPSDCQIYPILKVLAEAEEIKDLKIRGATCYRDGLSWREIVFWIRRNDVLH